MTHRSERGLSRFAIAIAITCAGAGACAEEPGISSREFASRAIDCPGAYTPGGPSCIGSIELPDESDAGAGGDFWDQQRLIAESNGTRCLQLQGPPGTPCTLQVRVQTQSLPGSHYGPANSGAIWVESTDGVFVRTLDFWAVERKPQVALWGSKTCGMPRLDAPLLPDAISRATLDDHAKPHVASWDGRDFYGALVPDGTYTLAMELAENEFTPPSVSAFIEFQKGPIPMSANLPAPVLGFLSAELSYTPGGAAPALGAAAP